jgi:hypothetical protein
VKVEQAFMPALQRKESPASADEVKLGKYTNFRIPIKDQCSELRSGGIKKPFS